MYLKLSFKDFSALKYYDENGDCIWLDVCMQKNIFTNKL